MHITVQGLWHLGAVTAACCASQHTVVGLDFDPAVVARLNEGKAPILEPGLDEKLAENLAAGRLSFSSEHESACASSDVLWLTYDTPVDDSDVSDAEYVLSRLRRSLPWLRPGALVLISSQLPVGSCAALEKEHPHLHFACSPENLRLGRALEAFEKADRVIVGLRTESLKPLLETLFAAWTPRLIFMRTESAEMVKHALNSFLAVSISYINEVARLCEHVGADAGEVTAGLKSDARIGPKAYLGAGGPFAGGTLARDVVTLTGLGERFGERLEVIPAIKLSNDFHRNWTRQKLQARFGALRGLQLAVLGLTYTPGTDTLRRSAAVEFCRAALREGAELRACDPAVAALPEDLAAIPLTSLAEACAGADAVIVCTEWPEFRQAAWPDLVASLRHRVVIDPNRFLAKELGACQGVEHLSVGRAS